ncbi:MULTISPECIES: hypothetical protein [Rhodopseudomonas]|uniref:hypothetical protein n=1 Tax=Rhodopseudomonas TaxID=1073 RepID=UPI00142DAE2F|nr:MULTISPECIES: hypothetical protein [Rhodopseudomonas]
MSHEQPAGAMFCALHALEFFELLLEFLEQRQMHIAIQFDEVRQQYERTFRALDAIQR